MFVICDFRLACVTNHFQSSVMKFDDFRRGKSLLTRNSWESYERSFQRQLQTPFSVRRFASTPSLYLPAAPRSNEKLVLPPKLPLTCHHSSNKLYSASLEQAFSVSGDVDSLSHSKTKKNSSAKVLARKSQGGRLDLGSLLHLPANRGHRVDCQDSPKIQKEAEQHQPLKEPFTPPSSGNLGQLRRSARNYDLFALMSETPATLDGRCERHDTLQSNVDKKARLEAH